jgi:hypothetical protein
MPSDRKRTSNLLLLAILIACDAAAVGETRTIERIVAVVEDRPALLSEVRTLARLRGVSHKTALEALIDELLMYREALRFPPAHATPEEEESALSNLMRVAANAAGLTESDLRRMARRQATILKYIAMRLGPQIRIDPENVRRLYDEEYAQEESAPPFESVSEKLERRLRERELNRSIEVWVQTLRQEARIRYNDESDVEAEN